MVQNFGETISGVVMGGIPVLVIGTVVILLICLAIGVSIFLYKRKKWNLIGDAVLLRSNLNDQYEDKVKGYWDAENGWIVLKRKGYRKTHTRPFDPKVWLTGRNRFKVIQTGPEEFVIARVEWSLIKDSETGELKHISTVIADVGKRKTWKNYTERMGKKTFTLRSWAENHQFAIALSIVIFCIFLGFSILWMRMTSMQKEVLQSVTSAAPVVSGLILVYRRKK
jgi:hypothetical protein